MLLDGPRRSDFAGTSSAGPNVSASGLVIPPEASRSSSIVPPAVWTCEASSHARRRPARPEASRASAATRPILPAMRRLLALVVLATLFASCGGPPAAGSDRPVRILTGEPTTLDPAAQGDAGSAAITAQLFESLTTLRRRPAGPPGPRRIVAVRRRRTAGHVPPPAGPDLLGRHPAPAVGRRPQLAAADRPGAPVAAGLARPRHHGRRGLPARARRPTRPRSACTPTTRPATSSSTSSGRPPTSSTSSPARRFAVVPPGVGSDRPRP